ncbi:hypothetical protein SPRG_15705 [Saprolegnia parasitica CBS 223.65]|uniref:LYC1 C-terminal domain-containing protein n=1 Tax=Saprolegnia parasitica (strain CBS 223.65) TaxID=695850 RepID=A0A067BQU0_SAPPC|nr:hypothetical protein SPRG_15705 [Saprolegnia parasitica CBS 223.65]KDO19140.1 hypothetical protein SPRG_15705 [Saprolegnia parasitica CBS 223.65]|eukprot:XP_012210138.1 hypothetical protein SPRG_15705 [Saprolegnia parasitica CBS 223.65]
MGDVELRIGDDAQETQVDVLTYEEWGAPHLTYDEYLDREDQFRATAFAQDAVTDYVLVPTSDPGTLDLRGYLEVFKRPVVLRPWNKSAGLVYLDGWSVASVFTPARHRKQGYASAMLAAFLQKKKDEEDQYTVVNLYSDIGTGFYATRGYVLAPSLAISLPTSTTPSRAELPRTWTLRLLESHADLEAIAAHDRERLAASLAPGELAFLLSADAITFFHVQHAYFARKHLTLPTLPTTYGVVLEAAGSILGYLVWAHNFEENALDILKYAGSQPDVFAACLATLHEEAAQWGLANIVLWPTDEMALPTDVRATATPRDDSLSMVLVRSSEEEDAPYTWVANEKYLYA